MRMASRWPAVSLASPVTVGVLLCIVAAVSLAGAGYIASQVIERDTPGISIAFYEGIFGISFILLIRGRNLVRGGQPSRSALPWLVLAGGCNALGVGAFYTALSHAPLSVAAPITGVTPLVAYVFVLLLLRGQERITRRVLFGAALVVSGVILVGVSSS